jgi:hypothetical protein
VTGKHGLQLSSDFQVLCFSLKRNLDDCIRKLFSLPLPKQSAFQWNSDQLVRKKERKKERKNLQIMGWVNIMVISRKRV